MFDFQLLQSSYYVPVISRLSSSGAPDTSHLVVGLDGCIFAAELTPSKASTVDFTLV